MIELSVALNHHFIAELYLSRMRIVPALHLIQDCMLTITDQEIRITHPVEDDFLWVYKRIEKEK